MTVYSGNVPPSNHIPECRSQGAEEEGKATKSPGGCLTSHHIPRRVVERLECHTVTQHSTKALKRTEQKFYASQHPIQSNVFIKKTSKPPLFIIFSEKSFKHQTVVNQSSNKTTSTPGRVRSPLWRPLRKSGARYQMVGHFFLLFLNGWCVVMFFFVTGWLWLKSLEINFVCMCLFVLKFGFCLYFKTYWIDWFKIVQNVPGTLWCVNMN